MSIPKPKAPPPAEPSLRNLSSRLDVCFEEISRLARPPAGVVRGSRVARPLQACQPPNQPDLPVYPARRHDGSTVARLLTRMLSELRLPHLRIPTQPPPGAE